VKVVLFGQEMHQFSYSGDEMFTFMKFKWLALAKSRTKAPKGYKKGSKSVTLKRYGSTLYEPLGINHCSLY
jgi:hypothetical protein